MQSKACTQPPVIDSVVYRFGPQLHAHGATFRLFAPAAQQVTLVVRDAHGERNAPMQRNVAGWFWADDAQARPAARYGFRIDGNSMIVPDPASRFQPDGVHGLSELLDPAALRASTHDWRGRPWVELVFYELHVGTFTLDGTYTGAIERLDDLVELGVTAIELMPLSQWPGERNWGYDGVLPYAPAHRYGRPEQLVAFIEAAHERGLAVILDVVYNHFGPEGNYLHGYAPTFFTDRYQTPWGAAINYASDDVRAFTIENAHWWLGAYGFDGLRLDATQMIFDERSPNVLRELRATIGAWTPPNRHVHLIVENDENDVKLLEAGYDAQWNDDFHHALHVLLTGESGGYYVDYATDPTGLLGRTLTSGYAYRGEPSVHRNGEPRGSSSVHERLGKFVDFLQNHDQIGNRAFGERLAALTPPAALRAAVAILLLAPSPPLLFMGDEWGASTPFFFFCDFEPDLAQLVTAGRRREFAGFPQFADPTQRESIPDPCARATFEQSRLHWDERTREPHRALLAFYTQLLATRRREIVPRAADVRGTDANYSTHGVGALRATWQLADGMLVLQTNLTAQMQGGFGAPTGRTLFETDGWSGELAPAWAVRWSIT